MTSTSAVQSGRHDGNGDGRGVSSPVAAKPIPAISSTISSLDSVGAEQRVDPGDADVDAPAPQAAASRLGIDHAVVDDEVGAGEPEQLDEAGDGQRHAVRVDTTIEAQRRLAAQPEAAGGLGDADRLEPGDLERDRRGRVADLAVAARP